MDTVTESELAIALAKEGGIGMIHKNMSDRVPDRRGQQGQAQCQRDHLDPVTLPPDAPVAEARDLMDQHNVSGIPITPRRTDACWHSHPPRSAVSGEQRICRFRRL